MAASEDLKLQATETRPFTYGNIDITQIQSDPRKLRIYLDGVFDMTHYGHFRLLWTVMNQWNKNVVLNHGGACYALSRGALRKLYPIFETEGFLNDDQRKDNKHCYHGMHGKGPGEDTTISICLRSLGINPTNTLDNNFRERFLRFGLAKHLKLDINKGWFWMHKHPKMKNCCSDNLISFHGNKKPDEYKLFVEMDVKYNKPEGEDGKVFEVPMKNNTGPFLFDSATAPKLDEYLNAIEHIPKGQRIYKGPGKERYCWQCDGFKYK